ncbi:triggering receptor expressed on myeloid cells 1 [Mycteria americana]|uniref:triggering receptor expressed on myeloid cells 1 n=1 Tax=Mycteria americana TaxID=33587 RepID=UPI003F58EE81
MELRVLLLLPLCFPGLQAQALDAEESRPEGSTLYIQCPYTAHSYHWQQKAWCLLRDGKCDPLVETTYQRQYPNTTRARKGRVSIEDDRTNRTVSITMTNLQAEDSGTYYCTYYDYRHGYLPLKKISLNVFKELHKSELDSLSVQCKYSAMAHSTDQKAWCRRQGQDECIFVVRNNYPSTRHNSRALEGRVSIQDDTQKRTVTITMKKLQAQDTGVYWCAFYSHLYFTRITEVKLSVSKRTQQYTAEESGNVSVQCRYSAPDYGAVSKAWCKEGASKECTVLVNTDLKPSGYLGTPQQGRVTIQDDTQQGTVTITMQQLQAQDSGVYWCALNERPRLLRMAEVTLSVSEVSAGTTLSGTGGTSQSTPSDNTPPPRLQIILQLVIGIVTSKILAIVILVFLIGRRKRNSTVKASRADILNGTRWAAPSNAPSLGLRTAMELRVLLLLPLCFPGLQAQALDAEESRPEGSTLYIQCPYTAHSYYWQQKAWCLLRDGKCDPLVETTYQRQYPNTTRARKGRVSIEDDRTNRTVSITMTNLQAEDSGTYCCTYYDYRHGYLPLKMISLNVFKELHKSELDSLSVQCKYSAMAHSTDQKAWCRRQGQDECEFVVRNNYPSTRHNSRALEGRVSIQDDTQKRTVTITMKKLQAQDTGVYWCAFYSHLYFTRITEVKLSVSKRTQQYTAEESGNVSVQCRYSAPDYGAVSKAWCKEGASKECTVLVNTDLKPSGYLGTPQQGRVTIQDDTQQGTVTITMQQLQAQDSGVYWCALNERPRLLRMAEVTLSVSEVSAGTTLSGTGGTSQSTPSDNTPAPSLNVNAFIILSGVLSILFILALISMITLCVRRRKQLKRRGTSQAEDTYEKPEDIAQFDSTERMESPKDDSKDLKYVTLNFKSQLSPEDPLYCNVEPNQTHRKPKDENVEYAVVAFKQLPTNDKG